MSTKPVRHIAGEFTEGMQFCVICGLVICDYRNVMVYPAPTEDNPISGWEDGELFVKGVNPTIWSKACDEEYIDCNKI